MQGVQVEDISGLVSTNNLTKVTTGLQGWWRRHGFGLLYDLTDTVAVYGNARSLPAQYRHGSQR